MGKLIVLEGIDGCGKSTLMEGLATEIRKVVGPVLTMSFPTEGTVTGQMVQKVLRGERTDCQSVYRRGLLFAADRLWNFPWEKYKDPGCVILADRYVTSNLIYQGAKCQNCERADVVSWLKDLEYDRLMLPEPDLVLYLQLPPLEARRRLLKRAEYLGVALDRNERDWEYQKDCYALGMEMAKVEWWSIIPCLGRTPEQIVVECMEYVKGILQEEELLWN